MLGRTPRWCAASTPPELLALNSRQSHRFQKSLLAFTSGSFLSAFKSCAESTPGCLHSAGVKISHTVPNPGKVRPSICLRITSALPVPALRRLEEPITNLVLCAIGPSLLL